MVMQRTTMALKRGRSRDQRLRFEQTAMPHLDAVYTAALRLARNSDDARDLLQETILRAYQCFHQFTQGTNCRAWLLTILYNNFRNSYRRGVREHAAASDDDFERGLETQSFESDQACFDPEQIFAGRMIGRQIELALDSLRPEFRDALILVDVQDLDYQEVSEVLSVPLGTVKSRVSRGRALMREALLQLAPSRSKTGS